MKAKKITDFIPGKEEETLVQARVSSDLVEQARVQMRKDSEAGTKMNWNILVEASIKAYLHERKRVSKK